MIAFWYDYLVYGRGLTFIVIIAVSGVARALRRNRSSGRRSTSQFTQQGYPGPQYQQPPQGYPQQQYPQPQQQYPQQPYPQQQYPQQPYVAPPPPPTSPFVDPATNPFAPGYAAPGERPRSTPLPPLLGSDPPPPPQR
ncbi:MAG: hypothetical protein JWM34_2043 [Ilumatobacteraceae bacterium]|nr:hypothetical protein [Ilumatobacteraceae bacterium]